MLPRQYLQHPIKIHDYSLCHMNLRPNLVCPQWTLIPRRSIACTIGQELIVCLRFPTSESISQVTCAQLARSPARSHFAWRRLPERHPWRGQSLAEVSGMHDAVDSWRYLQHGLEGENLLLLWASRSHGSGGLERLA